MLTNIKTMREHVKKIGVREKCFLTCDKPKGTMGEALLNVCLGP